MMQALCRCFAGRIMQVMLLVLAGYGFSGNVGYAAESAPVVTSHTRASLVSDEDSLPTSPPVALVGERRPEMRSLHVGLRLQLQPGWHTYWQNPGDAGEPAHIHVTVKGAYTGVSEQIDWPVPERISEGGLMAYAYQGDVLLPLHVPLHLPDLAQSGAVQTDRVHVTAQADWLVCADVCVPESGHFELDVPVEPAGTGDGPPRRENAEAALFRRAEAATPQPSPFAARITVEGMLEVSGAGLAPEAVEQGWFLPQEGGVIAQNLSQPLSVQQGKLTLRLKPDPYVKPPYWQKPLAGVLVLVDGVGNRSALQLEAQPTALAASGHDRAGGRGEAASAHIGVASGSEAGTVSGSGPGQAAAVAGSNADGVDGLWGNLLSAFLGGVILNLMPCVFPVLAMKLLSFAHMGGAGWRVRGRSAAFYSVGIMGCFAALGGAMMALRYGGAAVGWGFQFQSTGFVVGMGWLLFVLALNLLGVFQITGGRLAGRAGQMAAGHGPGSDLLAGLLAVIVATPCTAPFMGVAIAAALGGPYWAGLLIFLSMGLGLAAPYALLALMPGLARHMPRPGAWMERLKQFLAFPLLASCVWLLWVAVLQRGGGALLLMAGGAVLLGFAGWLYGLAQRKAMAGEVPRLVLLGRLIAVLCLLACLVGLGQMAGSGSDVQSSVVAGAVPAGSKTGVKDKAGMHGDDAALMEPFSEERLARLRAAGRPVFVDMTAAWCVTCMVNEHVALDVSSTRRAFRQHGVTLLRGDWTRRDERITAFLKAHGRDGVPLYIYYPAHGEGKILPQILTPTIMTDVLNAP